MVSLPGRLGKSFDVLFFAKISHQNSKMFLVCGEVLAYGTSLFSCRRVHWNVQFGILLFPFLFVFLPHCKLHNMKPARCESVKLTHKSIPFESNEFEKGSIRIGSKAFSNKKTLLWCKTCMQFEATQNERSERPGRSRMRSGCGNNLFRIIQIINFQLCWQPWFN